MVVEIYLALADHLIGLVVVVQNLKNLIASVYHGTLVYSVSVCVCVCVCVYVHV